MALETASQLPRLRLRASRLSRTDLSGAALAVAGSLLAAGFSLQLWRMHIGIPLAYGTGNDSLVDTAMVKLVVHGTGWIYSDRQLGAPFGLNLADFPLGTDNLNYAAMWVIGRFTGNVGAVENLWFLSTFPLEALAAYGVMRWMGISMPAAVVAAVLFSDAPYHLFRGENHLLLSEYVTVPLATYLCISLLDGRRLLNLQLRPFRWRSLFSARNLWILLLAAVIGSTGVYYAAFTMVLLLSAGLVTALRGRLVPLGEAVAVVIAILAICGLNDLPGAVYRLEHGSNPAVAIRPASDSEAYGLKFAAMALPVSGDRIAPLASIRARYDTNNASPGEGQDEALGTLGTLGLAWLLLVALAAVARVATGAGEFARRQSQLSFLALVSLLLGTIGGVSALIAYLFVTQIRDWDRISIFIDLFALTTVAMALDALARSRWLRSRWYLAVLGLVAVGVFGVIDQSSLDVVPTYRATAASWNTAAGFAATIQRTLPAGSSVFELPYVSFPESPPVNNTWSYDQLAGWLHTETLSWTFPAMRGRPADWENQTVNLPTRTLLDGVAAAGFGGIWVDRWGYPAEQAPVIPQLQTMLREQPSNSADGRYAFFDIRRYARALGARVAATRLASLRAAILYPPQLQQISGFYGIGVGGTSNWAVSTVQLSATNLRSTPRTVLFYTEVRSQAPGSYSLLFELPGGVSRSFTISDRQRLVEFPFKLPPGTSVITIDTNAPAGSVPGLAAPTSILYSNPLVVGTGLGPFLPRTATTDLP